MGEVRRLMEKSILNFHFDSWNPSLNMMISSVHLNQRFLTNLSRLRALVSQRRKSHKGWKIYWHICWHLHVVQNTFAIRWTIPGNGAHKIFSFEYVVEILNHRSVSFLSIHSWGLSENTLVLVPPTNLSDMFNSNFSGQFIVDTSVTRYSGWPMSSWRNIFSPSGSKVLLRDLREAWKP